MPQSDVLSFLSQYIWLVATFFFFVILLSSVILPEVYSLLFVRKKLENKDKLGLQSGEIRVMPSSVFMQESFVSLKTSNKSLIDSSVVRLGGVDGKYLKQVTEMLLS